MQVSTELSDLTVRFYSAVSDGEIEFIEQYISEVAELVAIGTDPDEWWTDTSAIAKMLRTQAEAGIKVEGGNPLAYSEGSVGWVVDRPRFVLPDDTEIPARWTAIFHQEADQWKMVHWHASIGVSNEEEFGDDLSS